MSENPIESLHNLNKIKVEDKQLLHKIGNGDMDAFRILYREYYPPLCIYASSFTKAKDAAEEVVQDVFVRLWEQRESIFINTSLRSYLYISVKNASLNHLKHLQVANRYNEYYSRKYQDAQDLYYMTQESGDALLIAKELEDKLLEEINSLPGQCRKIFLMSRFDYLTHQEIAENLGITINTVHRQTSIALERLRKAIKKYFTVILFWGLNLLIG